MNLYLETQKEENKTYIDFGTSETKGLLRDLQGRRLWEGEFDYNWEVMHTNILGQDAKIGYFVELADGKIKNFLRLEVGCYSYSIGNERGLNPNKKNGSENKDGIPIGKIPLGCLPIFLFIKLGGSFTFGVVFDKDDIFRIQFDGKLSLSVGVEFGINNAASVEVGARGDLISVIFSTAIKKKRNLIYSMDRVHLKVSTGKVSI